MKPVTCPRMQIGKAGSRRQWQILCSLDEHVVLRSGLPINPRVTGASRCPVFWKLGCLAVLVLGYRAHANLFSARWSTAKRLSSQGACMPTTSPRGSAPAAKPATRRLVSREFSFCAGFPCIVTVETCTKVQTLLLPIADRIQGWLSGRGEKVVPVGVWLGFCRLNFLVVAELRTGAPATVG